jgi:aerobic-type carbon monoxide dehydrogenase small subunit (CoxS/CutS family)
MPSYSFTVNGEPHTVETSPDTPLLWVLRDMLHLTGTKYGCGVGECGTCTCIVENEVVRSCVTPIMHVARRSVTTIEGLSQDLEHPLQRAWIEEDVSQCGYCQPGMLMSAATLLRRHPMPTDEQIDEALEGHVCRCGTYQRIRRAIHRAAEGGAP